jgi:hypothetical protein
MNLFKAYKKNILENTSFLIISIVAVCLIRLGFVSLVELDIFSFDSDGNIGGGISGYVWAALAPYLQNELLSVVLSLIFTLGIMLFSVNLNSKHKLIRKRTYLIYVFPLLLFSAYPAFAYMSAQYVSTFLLLTCADTLLCSYQKSNAAGNAYAAGFILGVASLFSFGSLMYFPLLWIGLGCMHSLRLKPFLASWCGLITIYWLAFFYFLWLGDIGAFYEPFKQLYPILGHYFESISISQLVTLLVCGMFLIIIIANYWTNPFDDKVQIRANVSLLFIFSVFSYLLFPFVAYDPVLNLYVFMAYTSILLAHFFTLADEKWKIYLFYIFLSLYFLIIIYCLFGPVITTIEVR